MRVRREPWKGNKAISRNEGGGLSATFNGTAPSGVRSLVPGSSEFSLERRVGILRKALPGVGIPNGRVDWDVKRIQPPYTWFAVLLCRVDVTGCVMPSSLID